MQQRVLPLWSLPSVFISPCTFQVLSRATADGASGEPGRWDSMVGHDRMCKRLQHASEFGGINSSSGERYRTHEDDLLCLSSRVHLVQAQHCSVSGAVGTWVSPREVLQALAPPAQDNPQQSIDVVNFYLRGWGRPLNVPFIRSAGASIVCPTACATTILACKNHL